MPPARSRRPGPGTTNSGCRARRRNRSATLAAAAAGDGQTIAAAAARLTGVAYAGDGRARRACRRGTPACGVRRRDGGASVAEPGAGGGGRIGRWRRVRPASSRCGRMWIRPRRRGFSKSLRASSVWRQVMSSLAVRQVRERRLQCDAVTSAVARWARLRPERRGHGASLAALAGCPGDRDRTRRAEARSVGLAIVATAPVQVERWRCSRRWSRCAPRPRASARAPVRPPRDRPRPAR